MSVPAATAPSAAARPSTRIGGLDTVRLCAALSVMFAHIGIPPFPHWLPTPFSRETGEFIRHILFTGHPAVMVFFVISGFCIHYPHLRFEGRFPFAEFWTRRWLRVGIPMLVAIPLAAAAGVKNYNPVDGFILWSLVCELIYYTLYPAIRLAARRVGWGRCVAVSFAASLLFVLLAGSNGCGAAHIYGPGFNWLVALPAWLLGCLLAEETGRRPLAAPRRPVIWLLRAGIFFLASLLCYLTFHSPIGYYLTMNPFALCVYGWLRREIAWNAAHRPSPLLEAGGEWSYSIYLFHAIAWPVYGRFFLPAGRLDLRWLFQTAALLAACYLFHRLVEKPSHLLAKRAGRAAGLLFDTLHESPNR